MSYIKNLVQLLGLFFSIAKNIRFQKKFLLQQVGSIIEQSKKFNDGSLDAEDFRKISRYGYAIPAMLGETFCVLRGQKMSDNERLAITYLGSVTGLFDDFFDKKNIPVSQIKRLVENPDITASNNSYEKLIVTLFNKAIENCSDKNQLKTYCIKVLEAEVRSKKQMLPNIEREEIKEIIFEKGGVSMLLYSCALGRKLSDADKTIIFKLGSIGQLENDIFDVYKDYHEGIRTQVTTETKISNLRRTYTELIDEIFELVHATSYPIRNKRLFLRMLALVLCRGYVCLDYLEKNEKSTNGLFSVESYEKRKLTCDMEKPSSFFMLLHYAANRKY